MKYKIALHRSGEGCSVRAPGLPGYRSQGETGPRASFATVRLRTAKKRSCLSEKSALSLAHQPAMSAEKRWGRLRGLRHPADVITDVRFIDGVNEKETGREAAGLRTAIHNL